MIPVNNTPIAQLPIIPRAVLTRHKVCEYFDNRFRSCARLLQAKWREQQDLYLHLGGKLAQISLDHVTSGNLLTQCLGGFGRESRIDPHITTISLPPGAQLLLCTDGLTSVLTDEQIASSLGQGRKNAVERLVAAALQGGGHDNISVVLVEIPPSR
jgi:hypothetical protein